MAGCCVWVRCLGAVDLERHERSENRHVHTRAVPRCGHTCLSIAALCSVLSRRGLRACGCVLPWSGSPDAAQCDTSTTHTMRHTTSNDASTSSSSQHHHQHSSRRGGGSA